MRKYLSQTPYSAAAANVSGGRSVVSIWNDDTSTTAIGSGEVAPVPRSPFPVPLRTTSHSGVP